ncbi:MAG: M24 family metallopeptidase [Conexivisphaera sp.]
MVSEDVRRSRLERAAEGYDTLIVAGDANAEYLTGCHCPGSALVYRSGSAVLLVPALEYYKAVEQVPGWMEVKPILRRSTEAVELHGLLQATLPEAAASLARGRVAADLGVLSRGLADELSSRIQGISDISQRLLDMRSVKDQDEVDAVLEALRITESAMGRALRAAREGALDFEVAAEFEAEARRLGAERFAFDTLVGVGPNSANPHALPRGLRISRGDYVVIDAGAVRRGYCSDMTRTIATGDDGLLAGVDAAVQAALDVLAPGVPAGDVDAAARRELSRRGLSKYFLHSLGHGVGIEVHEPPYLAPGERRILEPGMIVTVEPGVYIRGEGGVRIEEMALVTPRGSRLLNSMPRIFQ